MKERCQVSYEMQGLFLLYIKIEVCSLDLVLTTGITVIAKQA